jgi:ASC-1-like (ASCH) protein/ribosomal protein S18 acetylase RimI-like enzyme
MKQDTLTSKDTLGRPVHNTTSWPAMASDGQLANFVTYARRTVVNLPNWPANMPASKTTALSAPLADELRDVLHGGIDAALDLHLPELAAAASHLHPDSLRDSSYLEAVLSAALLSLGDTPFSRSAERLFGLTEDTRAQNLGTRQVAAAEQIPISARHFRRPGSYQDQVIASIANAIGELSTPVALISPGIHQLEQQITIREALEGDRAFVLSLMTAALNPYYGGDHAAHAKRIFETHLKGGQDHLGFFSTEQRMFIAVLGDALDSPPLGMIHLVGKRQDTFKISPLIVHDNVRGRLHVGSKLLRHAEQYAIAKNARQLYCTVARDNRQALQFFIRNGFVVAGRSASHYKVGMTELMLYKLLTLADTVSMFDRPNISVLPLEPRYESEVRKLLLAELPKQFSGIDNAWVDALFEGYTRRSGRDVNKKYKLIYVAVDRSDKVLGVAGATPKKGEPIKLMPLIARTQPAFTALITDIPYHLRSYGRRIYAHISAGPEETITLQKQGWHLDAALPAAYHEKQVTQQWSIDIDTEDFMRTIRVKQRFLDYIKAGTKPLEVRVGYDFIKTIEIGERIRFAARDDEQVVVIQDVRKYKNFKDMAEVENLSLIVPGKSNDEVMKTLREIYPQKRERLGVYVLQIAPEWTAASTGSLATTIK